MDNSCGYRKLLVWKESHKLILLIYQITQHFPKDEIYGLISQIRRAAISIGANIVEGYARQSRKELLQFLSIAKGSLAEVEYYVDLSFDLRYISQEEYIKLTDQRILVGKLLHGFMQSVKENSN